MAASQFEAAKGRILASLASGEPDASPQGQGPMGAGSHSFWTSGGGPDPPELHYGSLSFHGRRFFASGHFAVW